MKIMCLFSPSVVVFLFFFLQILLNHNWNGETHTGIYICWLYVGPRWSSFWQMIEAVQEQPLGLVFHLCSGADM